MTAGARVALIVDNPLRDLDGLVLVAYQLAQRGHTALLVPMYEQGFDVFELQPDVVLVNYVRANNRDLVRLYRRRGIRVGVLDTEGAGGKSAQEFARLVDAAMGGTEVDLYCVWGEDQFVALSEGGTVNKDVLHLTGCPRYDYCAPPWRATLEPVVPREFMLVNTNFPVVNPRYSTGSADERGAMIKAGFSAEFADRYVPAAKRAQGDIIALIERLARALPHETFVVRPHPFENLAPYQALEHLGNVRAIQRGTSVQWLAAAKALLHMNCSTAVEAAMLSVEAVSPEWLNDATLRVPAAQEVSLCMRAESEMLSLLAAIANGAAGPPPNDVRDARSRVLRANYYAIDGRSAERVTQAVEATLNQAFRPPRPTRIAMRTHAVQVGRRMLGRSGFGAIERVLRQGKSAQQRSAKGFTSDSVRPLLDRLAHAAGGAQVALARPRGTATLEVRAAA